MILINDGRVLLSFKQFMILNGLHKFHYMSGAMRYSDVTFSHISSVCNFFLALDLITIDSGCKKKKVVLTSKGKEVLNLYLQLYFLLNDEVSEKC